jgi:hypothetical protein
MKYNYLTLIFFGLSCFYGCSPSAESNPNMLVTNKEANAVINIMTEIMVHDISNPPLASRFYSYACLAGYEIVAENNPSFKSMHYILKDYPIIKKPNIVNYSYRIAAVFSMLETAKALQPSGNKVDSLENYLSEYFTKKGTPNYILDSSIIYGKTISKEILKYAKGDGYRLISSYKRYSPFSEKGSWYPTPPLYLNAIEPYFNTVRTFYLDSSSQFKPKPPIKFDELKSSGFYNLMQEVYVESKTSSQAHREIASFWDCNPFAVLDKGHLQFGIKKISPGAHWMGIAGIACKQTNLSFDSTLQVYAILSSTIMDAFNSCWDEKYRSNRIRPETVIRQYIDSSWQPFLQTPPFPEYLSGHSVVSNASAEILSYFFGNSFEYNDTVEKDYGLPDRKFPSFKEAASEAAISRFYGGIHFMDAITEGAETGRQIGAYVLNKCFKQR